MASSIQRCLGPVRSMWSVSTFRPSGRPLSLFIVGSQRTVAHFSDWKMPDGPESEDDFGTMFHARNPRNFTKDGIAMPRGWVEVPELTCFRTGRLLRKQYFYHESSGISQYDFPKGPPTRDQLLQQREREKADKIILTGTQNYVPGENYGPVQKPKKGWTFGRIMLTSFVAVPTAVFFSHHCNRWLKQQDNIFSDGKLAVDDWIVYIASTSGELAVTCQANLNLISTYTATMREVLEAKIAEFSDEGRKADSERSQERSRRLKSL
eukprot:gnl/MRDRNA2_/MRDRNA2_33296_c0_seq1.p1 gnl/MRDRNA2_/MRDRNA2_33296_c0~~gnl/MRDRNA2_/MRDRNA2_33296_c0_seq1.p1  ORF type:complete len:265 (+),score=37.78 gnl/MRDRNA2_/MRDRNA2_33296_c0_seq1:61-855(+)